MTTDAAPNGAISYADLLRETEEQRKRFFAYLARKARLGAAFSALGAVGAASPAGGMEKPPQTTPFYVLKSEFQRSPIDKAIVATRQQQIRQVSRRALIPEKETGWRVVHRRHADPNFANTPEIEARCREVEEAIASVDEAFCPGGLSNFLAIAVHDQLVFDRKVVVLARDRLGRVRRYWPLDPTTVYPRVEVLARYMASIGESSLDRAAERLSEQLYRNGVRGAMGQPLDLADCAYVQIVDGRITGCWRADEISVDVTNPQNAIDQYFYGRSMFELSLDVTKAFNAAFVYNTSWFESRVPETLVFFGGDIDPEGLAEFEKDLFGQSGSAAGWRTAFVQGSQEFEVKSVQLRQSMREMAFVQWLRFLIALKCAAYRMDPREINFDLATGNDQALWRNASREQQLTLAEEQGFHSLIFDLENWLQRAVVDSYDPELVVRWVGLERASEADRIAMLAQKLSGWMSINEVRNEAGALPPIVIPGYEGVTDLPASAWLIQAMQAQDNRRFLNLQEEQMRLQIAQLGVQLQTLQLQLAQQMGAAPAPQQPPAGQGPESGS